MMMNRIQQLSLHIGATEIAEEFYSAPWMNRIDMALYWTYVKSRYYQLESD